MLEAAGDGEHAEPRRVDLDGDRQVELVLLGDVAREREDVVLVVAPEVELLLVRDERREVAGAGVDAHDAVGDVELARLALQVQRVDFPVDVLAVELADILLVAEAVDYRLAEGRLHEPPRVGVPAVVDRAGLLRAERDARHEVVREEAELLRVEPLLDVVEAELPALVAAPGVDLPLRAERSAEVVADLELHDREQPEAVERVVGLAEQLALHALRALLVLVLLELPALEQQGVRRAEQELLVPLQLAHLVLTVLRRALLEAQRHELGEVLLPVLADERELGGVHLLEGVAPEEIAPRALELRAQEAELAPLGKPGRVLGAHAQRDPPVERHVAHVEHDRQEPVLVVAELRQVVRDHSHHRGEHLLVAPVQLLEALVVAQLEPEARDLRICEIKSGR